MLKYLVITADSCIQIQTSVNQYIKEGWQPLGGVSCVICETENNGKVSNNYHFYQAVTREERAEN